MDALYARREDAFEFLPTILNLCVKIEKMITLFLARFAYQIASREAGEAGKLLEVGIRGLNENILERSQVTSILIKA